MLGPAVVGLGDAVSSRRDGAESAGSDEQARLQAHQWRPHELGSWVKSALGRGGEGQQHLVRAGHAALEAVAATLEVEEGAHLGHATRGVVDGRDVGADADAQAILANLPTFGIVLPEVAHDEGDGPSGPGDHDPVGRVIAAGHCLACLGNGEAVVEGLQQSHRPARKVAFDTCSAYPLDTAGEGQVERERTDGGKEVGGVVVLERVLHRQNIYGVNFVPIFICSQWRFSQLHRKIQPICNRRNGRIFVINFIGFKFVEKFRDIFGTIFRFHRFGRKKFLKKPRLLQKII